MKTSFDWEKTVLNTSNLIRKERQEQTLILARRAVQGWQAPSGLRVPYPWRHPSETRPPPRQWSGESQAWMGTYHSWAPFNPIFWGYLSILYHFENQWCTKSLKFHPPFFLMMDSTWKMNFHLTIFTRPQIIVIMLVQDEWLSSIVLV